ncbi:hypothetical protein JCM10450v2_001005 [Rhodotorula kratochvilovae]
MGKDLDRFTTPLPDHLHCPVCLAAAYPPIAVCSAEHILCQGCVGDIFTTEQAPNCPTCRERMPPQLKVAQGFKRAIEGYSYNCEHDECSWVGSVGDEAQHLACSCECRLVPCPHCATAVRAKDIEAHVAAICPEAFVLCPRGLGACSTSVRGNGALMRRRELQAHEAVCAMFTCRIPGCPTRTTALNLPVHEKACASLISRLAQMERELKQPKADLAAARATVERSSSVERKRRDGVRETGRGAAAAKEVLVLDKDEPAASTRRRKRPRASLQVVELSSSDSEEPDKKDAQSMQAERPVGQGDWPRLPVASARNSKSRSALQLVPFSR